MTKSPHPNARPHFLGTFVFTLILVTAFLVGHAHAADPEKLDATVAGVTIYQAQVPTSTEGIVAPDTADAADKAMQT